MQSMSRFNELQTILKPHTVSLFFCVFQVDVACEIDPFERFRNLEQEWESDSSSKISSLREGLYGQVRKDSRLQWNSSHGAGRRQLRIILKLVWTTGPNQVISNLCQHLRVN